MPKFLVDESTGRKFFELIVFRLGRASSGIILLRTKTLNPVARITIIKEVLAQIKDLENTFVVASEEIVRVRKLPSKQ